ncbi:MAG: rhomboid family intramembrane serine protease [Bacteroidota bacterium]
MTRMTPVVEKLLWINIGLFIAQSFLFLPLAHILGLHYVMSTHFRVYQFLTHLFVHGSFMHLLCNMFSLYTFGPVLENTLSSKRFMAFYLGTGLGAAALYSGIRYLELGRIHTLYEQYLTFPDPERFHIFLQHFSTTTFDGLYRFSKLFFEYADDPAYIAKSKAIVDHLYTLKADMPTVGASGAIFGILTGFAVLFPNVEILIMFVPIPIKAKYFMALYALYELHAGLQNNAADNIAHFAHLGGVLFGYLYIRQWKSYY